jgi:hypothetical protein
MRKGVGKAAIIARRRWLLTGTILMFNARLANAVTDTNDVWRGGTGTWNAAAKWTNGVPNNGTPTGAIYDVFIDKDAATVSFVTLNIAATINDLSIDSGDRLSISDGNSLTLTGNIVNAGKLSLNATNDLTDLIVAAPSVTLSGSGTLMLSNDANNRILGASAADKLINQGIIQGSGQIGAGRLTLANSGTIKADQARALVVDTGGSAVVNTGTLEATAGGLLALQAPVTNVGGMIWGNGGTVLLQHATINGGILKGTIEVPSSFAATLGSPVNNSAGSINVDDEATLTLKNGNYAQLGKVQLKSTHENTDLVIDGAKVTLGSGIVTMSNNPDNRIYGTSAGNTLTNQGAIQGAGQIGVGQLTLINAGTISANQSEAITIDAVPSFTNNGTLAVSAGDFMRVTGGTFTDFNNGVLRGGIYDASGSLEIDQFGSSGGEILTNAASIILTGAGSRILDDARLDALTGLKTNSATGSFSLSGNRSFAAAGSFSNMGSLTIGAGSTFTPGGSDVFTQSAGTTTDDGTLSATGGLHVTGGSLTGSGMLNGSLQSSGIVTPGSTAKTGILTDVGTYTQSSAGSLDIGIGGTTSFDALKSTTAVLGGTLNLSELKGFVPTVGSMFKIVDFNSETGKFATVNGLTIDSKEAYTVTYQPTDVLLTVVSTPPSAADPGSSAR